MISRKTPAPPKRRVRVGRGIGSGVGKTGGRGVKGQKSRSGVAIKGFEGGQMPLYRRLPKRGFSKWRRKDFNAVNLGLIQTAIDAGRIDAGQPIDLQSLVAAGVLRRPKDGLRDPGRWRVFRQNQFDGRPRHRICTRVDRKSGRFNHDCRKEGIAGRRGKTRQNG